MWTNVRLVRMIAIDINKTLAFSTTRDKSFGDEVIVLLGTRYAALRHGLWDVGIHQDVD